MTLAAAGTTSNRTVAGERRPQLTRPARTTSATMLNISVLRNMNPPSDKRSMIDLLNA
jgi:hypothetical protein